MPADSVLPQPPAPALAAHQIEPVFNIFPALHQLSLALSVDVVYRVVCRAMQQLVAADGVAILQHQRCVSVRGQMPLELDQVVQWDTALTSAQADGPPAAGEWGPIGYRIQLAQPAVALILVPIGTLHPLGAIALYWQPDPRPWPAELGVWLQMLVDTLVLALRQFQPSHSVDAQLQQMMQQNQEMAHQIAVQQAIQQEMQQLSCTDELTGLYNRRGFLLLADQSRKLLRRKQITTCLLFMDLDGLKLINDAQGHEMGDRALQEAAQIMRQTLRESDLLARLGGDEFVAWMVSDTDHSQAICKRLQAQIAQANHQPHRSYYLSISIGMVTCAPDTDTPLEVLLDQADQRMYAAKRQKQQSYLVDGTPEPKCQTCPVRDRCPRFNQLYARVLGHCDRICERAPVAARR